MCMWEGRGVPFHIIPVDTGPFKNIYLMLSKHQFLIIFLYSLLPTMFNLSTGPGQNEWMTPYAMLVHGISTIFKQYLLPIGILLEDWFHPIPLYKETDFIWLSELSSIGVKMVSILLGWFVISLSPIRAMLFWDYRVSDLFPSHPPAGQLPYRVTGHHRGQRSPAPRPIHCWNHHVLH